MERTLVSRGFWILRACTILLQVAIIYRVDKMISDADAMNYILGVPPEFVPMIMVIALIVGMIGTFAMSLPDYYSQDKVVARSGGEKLSYGLSYLAANILTVVACVILSLVATGWYLNATGALATSGMCCAFAVVVSAIIGFGGSYYVSLPFVECLRDKSKAAEARATTATTTTATNDLNQLNTPKEKE